jgi:DMSO/TMAO reductase YedYZ molybdopterin-dependent catalytic subunit
MVDAPAPVATPSRPRRAPTWAAALAGAAAGLVAIAAGELFAGLVAGAPSLVVAVGDVVIALQPPGAKDLVVALFGTNDKLALQVVIVGVAVAIAAGAGVLASRRFRNGAALFVAFGLLAALAGQRDPLAEPLYALVGGVLAVGAGLAALRGLLALAGGVATRADRVIDARWVTPDDNGPAPDTGAAPGDDVVAPAAAPAATSMPDWDRRRFLIASAGTVGGALATMAVGRSLLDGRHGEEVVTVSRLPAALQPVPPLDAGQELGAAGITPLVVANDDFYRIDTALVVPRVKVDTWRLEVRGMVDRPLSFTYDELLEMPLFEQYVTISCVSNPVGGDLVGNALWTGVRLRDVLEAAGVQAGATQIVGRSVDGFTAGFPTAWALDPGREAMIAVGMNREPLPAKHGFPARLIVPGLYGYVSATKWLEAIELTTREAVDGYWIPLGWAKDAPILTQSRIDVPAQDAGIPAGPTEVAGVAWAPDRGVAGVDVRIDDGPWLPARTSRPISDATWVQWALAWDATPGRHRIEVRATDGTGDTQTEDRTNVAPDGARGHHRISVSIG